MFHLGGSEQVRRAFNKNVAGYLWICACHTHFFPPTFCTSFLLNSAVRCWYGCKTKGNVKDIALNRCHFTMLAGTKHKRPLNKTLLCCNVYSSCKQCGLNNSTNL